MTFIPARVRVTRTGHIHYLQRQKDPEQTTHNCNRSTDMVRVSAALAPASLPCLLLLHLCHHGLTPAVSAPLPTSARDSVPLAQHHRLQHSMGLHTLVSAVVVHTPAAWSRAHCSLSVRLQPCPGLDACDLIATRAHSAAWDLVLAIWDGHGVCSASWNPVPVMVAPKPSSAVVVVQSTAQCPWLTHLQCSFGPMTWISALAYMQDDTGPNAHGISACCLSLCNVVRRRTLMA